MQRLREFRDNVTKIAVFLRLSRRVVHGRFYLFYCIFRLVFHLLDFVPLLNALGFCTTVVFFLLIPLDS